MSTAITLVRKCDRSVTQEVEVKHLQRTGIVNKHDIDKYNLSASRKTGLSAGCNDTNHSRWVVK